MTEQEILDELDVNDKKAVRALLERDRGGGDFDRIDAIRNRQEELRKMLAEVRNAAA